MDTTLLSAEPSATAESSIPTVSDNASTLPKELTPSIVVIENSPTTISALTTFLQSQGMTVYSAMTKEEGVAHIEQITPDVIFLDIDSPALDGVNLCKTLNEDKATAHIPVIMLTGDDTLSGRVAEGFAFGAVDCVRKPFLKEEILARVNTQIELVRLRHFHRTHTLQSRVAASGQRALKSNAKSLILESHVNLLNRIHRELNKVLASDTLEHKNTLLKKTLNLIQHEVQMDVKIPDLDKRFRSINPNYHKILIEHCPTLTPKEIELCMLLRLGYSTKQICRMKGVLAPSVDAYRYRVRIKFKLTPKDNLFRYLVSILG